MHPIARCTIPVRTRLLPCRSVPVWTQSHCSAVPPRSEATRCTAVSPRWKAARRLNVGPVRTQARHPTISFLFAYPPLPRRRIAHRPLLTSCPLFEHSPVSPLCNSIRMHPLPRYAAAAHRQHPLSCHTETALLCRPCSNIPRCSSMPHGSKATPLPPVWVRHRFPRCTARFGCALLHRYAAAARKYACYPTISPVQRQSRCPLSSPSLAGELPRRPAVPPRSGGTAGRRLLFARLISRPKRPERVVFLFLSGRFFYGSS